MDFSWGKKYTLHITACFSPLGVRKIGIDTVKEWQQGDSMIKSLGIFRRWGGALATCILLAETLVACNFGVIPTQTPILPLSTTTPTVKFTFTTRNTLPPTIKVTAKNTITSTIPITPFITLTSFSTSPYTPLNESRIAYCAYTGTGSGAAIHLMNSDGSGNVRLTDASAYNTIPTWSPDGTKILFTMSGATQESLNGIYLMNANGSGLTRITRSTAQNLLPHWSPDGQKIVFQSMLNGKSEIHVINSDGSGETNLSYDEWPDTLPFWSPDGRNIIFTSLLGNNYEVMVMNADGSELTDLTNDPDEDSAYYPWSPDGKKIVFTSDHKGDRDIIMLDLVDYITINLSNDPHSDWLPRWSPDGKQVAFLSDRDGRPEIYLVNADGSHVTRLSNLPGDKTTISWSPDGKRIAFTGDPEEKGLHDIFVINVDGSSLTNLTHSAMDDMNPEWAPVESQLNSCVAGWTRLNAGSSAMVMPGDLPNRVRSVPEVADNVISLLYPGTIVKILEGPLCQDNLVFWKVGNADIPGGSGWTAEGDGKDYWLEPYNP